MHLLYYRVGPKQLQRTVLIRSERQRLRGHFSVTVHRINLPGVFGKL